MKWYIIFSDKIHINGDVRLVKKSILYVLFINEVLDICTEIDVLL